MISISYASTRLDHFGASAPGEVVMATGRGRPGAATYTSGKCVGHCSGVTPVFILDYEKINISNDAVVGVCWFSLKWHEGAFR
jgi:hypothetical protein